MDYDINIWTNIQSVKPIIIRNVCDEKWLKAAIFIVRIVGEYSREFRRPRATADYRGLIQNETLPEEIADGLPCKHFG